MRLVEEERIRESDHNKRLMVILGGLAVFAGFILTLKSLENLLDLVAPFISIIGVTVGALLFFQPGILGKK